MWERADARFALGFWPWPLLAQPNPHDPRPRADHQDRAETDLTRLGKADPPHVRPADIRGVTERLNVSGRLIVALDRAEAAHAIADLVGSGVRGDLVDRFALAGTPDDCSAALSRLAEAGLDAPIYCPPGVELLRQIDLVAEHLVPRWRRLIAARERGDGAAVS